MALCDGGQNRGQLGMVINGIQFGDLDERGNHCPVLRPSVVTREERVSGVRHSICPPNPAFIVKKYFQKRARPSESRVEGGDKASLTIL